MNIRVYNSGIRSNSIYSSRYNSFNKHDFDLAEKSTDNHATLSHVFLRTLLRF